MKRMILMMLAVCSLAACGWGYAGTETAEAVQTRAEATGEETEPSLYGNGAAGSLEIAVGEHRLEAAFEDNRSAEEFRELLTEGPVTVEMEDYGGFEKVGALGSTLTRCDEPITAEPGDVILYQGDQITVYYGTNSWNFTRLAKIKDPDGLKEKLGEGTVSITFSLKEEEPETAG